MQQKSGLKRGKKKFLKEKAGNRIVRPAAPEFYERTFGILKGSGLVKALKESRRKEKEHEDRKIEGR